MTSFIGLNFPGHGEVFCAQPGEDLLGWRYAAGGRIGEAASQRRIEGS
jgi:hypothetical protein